MEAPAARSEHPAPSDLTLLAPLSRLSPQRLNELAAIVEIEHARRGSDPIKGRDLQRQSVFLLHGEVLLAFRGLRVLPELNLLIL